MLVNAIHPELVKKFVEDTPYIYKFRNTFNRLAQVESNLKDLKKPEDQRFAKPLDEFSDWILLDQDDLELLDVNRLCSNFCISWVNIIELMEIKNKNIHGEESEIYKKMEGFGQ